MLARPAICRFPAPSRRDARVPREAGPGLIAEDLPEVLPAVFRRLYDEFGIDY